MIRCAVVNVRVGWILGNGGGGSGGGGGGGNMFNFASKVFNTIGDLINVEEPAKPPPTGGQQPQTLLRRASGDSAFFQQQQPKARFHGPTSLSDHNSFRGPGTGVTTSRDPRPSVPVYRYPSASTTSSGSVGTTTVSGYGPTTIAGGGYGTTNTNYGSSSTYRPPDRYEENKFKTPDIDYNEGTSKRFDIYFSFSLVLLLLTRRSTVRSGAVQCGVRITLNTHASTFVNRTRSTWTSVPWHYITSSNWKSSTYAYRR